MDTRKMHYFILALSYPIIVLHFIFSDYESHYFVSGLTFFTIAAIVYFGFVYLFFNMKAGKKITGAGLLLIAGFSLFMIVLMG